MSDKVTTAGANKVLPAEVAEQFKVVGWDKKPSYHIMSAKYGTINLRKLTVSRADSLVKMGCPFLEKKEGKAAPDKTEKERAKATPEKTEK